MTDAPAIDVPEEPRSFHYDGTVPPGEKRHFRYEISETYLGDPVEVPVTVINGTEPGPRLCLTAAVHGDELNGVKVCQEVAKRYSPSEIHGTLVVLHVVNVPAYQAQQRYIPIYDQDLKRSFPRQEGGNTASRMAHEVFERLLKPCDLCLDFHTSTRNRTTMYHARANVSDPTVERLTRALGANLVLSVAGDSGSLRAAATAAGTPTVTVEMRKAHRFQPVLIEKALVGVEPVSWRTQLRFPAIRCVTSRQSMRRLTRQSRRKSNAASSMATGSTADGGRRARRPDYSPKVGSSWNSKRAPPASLSVTVACQPCASAMVSTIASPKPVPPWVE
jgi:hypothetical protein